MPAAGRPVSGLERVWLVAERLLPPFAIQWVVEGEGRLRVEEVEAAIVRLAEAMPVVRARTAGVLRGTRWVYDGPLPQVRVREGAEWMGTDWEGEDSLGAPSSEEGLSGAVEVLLLDGRIVLRLRHALMDGLGSIQLLAALFVALRGEEIGPDAAVFDEELLARVSATPEPPPPRNALPPFVALPAEAAGRGWARRTWRGSTSALIPRVLLALATWTRAQQGEGVVRVDVPVDLRRHQPGLQSSSNLTGILRIDLLPDDDIAAVKDRLETALAANRQLGMVWAARGMRWLPLWFMAMVGRNEADKAQRTGRFGTTATVSTLGQVDLGQLSCPGWTTRRLFVVPPANPDLPLLITMVGTPAGVELCGTVPGWLGGAAAAGAVLDGICAGLAGD